METTLAPVTTVVQIPLEKILPNPHQPRTRFKKGSIQEMAESLKDKGQQTDAKVRPLTTEEKAANPGLEYLLIGGHRRLAGAKLAGLVTLNCKVMDILPDETHFASLMDNNLEEMDWWDWLMAIEFEDKSTGLSLRKLAERLGISYNKVFRALKIMAVLNPEARKMIEGNLADSQEPDKGESVTDRDTQNKGFLITEAALFALADLEHPALVERTLKVVLDHHLTEQKAKKLVEWVQKGNQPEDFGGKEPKDSLTDPLAAAWATLDPHLKVKYKGGEAYEVRISLEGQNLAWEAASAASRGIKAHLLSSATKPSPAMISRGFEDTKVGFVFHPAPAEASSPLTAGATSIAGNILWTQIKHIPAHILNRFVPRWFTRSFNKTTAGVQRMGVKNQGWAAVITLFLFLMVGGFLISIASRLVTRMAYRMVYSRQVVNHPPQNAAPQPAMVSQALPALNPAPVPAAVGGKQVQAAVQQPKSKVNTGQSKSVKPVTLVVAAPTQQADPTGKMIGQAVTTIAGDAAKKFLGF